jgi:hypothetical protein
VVNQTEIVEVEITPTALPPLVTPQGRELPPDAAPLDKQIFFEGGAGEPKHLDVARDLFSATAVLGWGGEQLLRLDEKPADRARRRRVVQGRPQRRVLGLHHPQGRQVVRRHAHLRRRLGVHLPAL